MANDMHYVPGRLRIKIPTLKSNPQEKLSIEAVFNGLEGLETIIFNEITGSVVFTFDQGVLNGHKILGILMENGYLQDRAPGSGKAKQNSIASKAGHAFSRSLLGFAVEKALEPMGLGFIGALI